ncbi:hypothetical protein [Acinetobacter junii]|uniref:hypothetical protein n=1 Tax=Acinetobacter junii TaxID=40215 RepID=UPI0012507DD8|nr:hypothetical protein [Acinetobacter junii]
MESENEVSVKIQPEISPYVLPKGIGYFESSFPDYITSEDGVPVSCEVRVHLRTVSTTGSDGALIAKTISKADGTWRIDGLNTNFKYDVICRHNGYNDLIYSNVSPLV